MVLLSRSLALLLVLLKIHLLLHHVPDGNSCLCWLDLYLGNSIVKDTGNFVLVSLVLADHSSGLGYLQACLGFNEGLRT